MKSLRDKLILITGGARGIGYSIARRLGQDGSRLLLADLDTAELERARESLQQEGLTCSVFTVDVTNTDSLAEFRQSVHDQIGPIDVLVNNAGVVFGGPFLELPLEKHLLTYRVNVDGVVAMTYNFLPDLIAAEEGHLVLEPDLEVKGLEVVPALFHEAHERDRGVDSAGSQYRDSHRHSILKRVASGVVGK